MALPGISNANEFYSAHYLESVLTNDIKKVRERWAEEARSQVEANPTADVSTPEALFKALRKPWQKLREAELGITADPAERLRLQRELFFQPLCEALGYPYAPKAEPVLIGGEAYQIPLLGEVSNAKGEPWLWVVECFNPSDEPADPLELTIATSWACQINDPSLGLVLEGETWEELISERIFAQDIPPRWVMAVSRDQLLLIDRQKWAASRLLRFELDTLLGENNPDAVLAAATLLHREHTCPTGGGTPLLDELDENSHKHAYEVSGDLKYALRRAIELLGNEAIHWRRSKGEGVFKGKTDADQLTLECLRYMYRLLFLFYIESRPDLGYAPMGSDVYRLGYSLESLRDMDTAELGSEEDKESTYISDSLNRLFQMIWEGYPKRDDETAQLPLADSDDPFHDSFRLTPLKAHLFDPERMPTLTRVRFRNVVLREVIELMSLTKEGKGKRRGRVSYSQLGINQLGAVYEALLSFRGFFAEEDLYEVQPAPKKGKAAASDEDDFDEGADEGDDDNTKASGQAHDELEVGHFVTEEQLKAYKADEIVPDPGTGKPKCYPKGSFIYRLAGRDREKSASYYTPESLTQCLVKYALKELLPGKTGADILQLKVCEPAMGSAAFLNEVVNQLAQKYLELRQQETGKSIPHEQFATELQKVKMRLADQNVFGVDLNPVAVELAEVSLWLNSIFTPENGRAFVPWFSQQLVCGNSLIGARRQIYRVSQLPTSTVRSARPRKLWHEHAPEELAWDAELPKDAIFHFLLPDPGMAAYTDKVIKELEPDAIERCKRWNKAFVGEPFTDAQIAHLLRLSKLVDALWKDWAEQQRQLRQRTTDPLPVWEDPTGAKEGDWTPLKLKDRIQEQEVLGRDVANTNARLRLKWAMDYWVALWFWPIRQAGTLPSRDAWLLELSMILGDLEQGVTPEPGQGNLFAETQPQQLAVDFSDRHGFVNVQKLRNEFERLRQVEALASRIRPLHWDLEYGDILKKGGFDLLVGNPPWMRTEWSTELILGDIDPLFSKDFKSSYPQAIAKTKAKECTHRNSASLLEEFEATNGTKEFLSARFAFPPLESNFNHYKCFLLLSSRISVNKGIIGFLHDVGSFEIRKEPALRRYLYPRLKRLFRFVNQLYLFKDLGNMQRYEISIFSPQLSEAVSFDAIFDLFHPSSIDISYSGDEKKPIKIKDKNGSWTKNGSRDRIIRVDTKYLEICRMLFSTDSGAEKLSLYETELLSPFSNELVNALEAMAKIEKSSEWPSFTGSLSCNEKSAKDDGFIEQMPNIADDLGLTVLSGPNLVMGNALGQHAMRKVKSQRSYLHTYIKETVGYQYRPRTQYKPVDADAFRAKYCVVNTPDGDVDLSETYRVGFRTMLSSNIERTVQSAIIPPGYCHVYSITSARLVSDRDNVYFSAFLCSTPIDFYARIMGKTALYLADLPSLPIPNPCKVSRVILDLICARSLALNCITKCYKDIWNSVAPGLTFGVVSRLDTSATHGADFLWKDSQLQKSWSAEQRLESHLERRQALVELDVLCAIALGLSLAELVAIYETQFPIMQQYEIDTWYDSFGNIVFTNSLGMPGVGLPRKGKGKAAARVVGWEDIRDSSESYIHTVIDQSNDAGDVEINCEFRPPYRTHPRVNAYINAWHRFQSLIGGS